MQYKTLLWLPTDQMRDRKTEKIGQKVILYEVRICKSYKTGQYKEGKNQAKGTYAQIDMVEAAWIYRVMPIFYILSCY